jgi:hypothetical protein
MEADGKPPRDVAFELALEIQIHLCLV